MRRKVNLFFIFILIFVFVALIINVSDIFSTIITNQKSIFFVDKLEYNSFSLYGVSLDDFDDEQMAKEYALQVQSKGAMGCTYQNGEIFVLANIYPTLIEAQEIKDNLTLLGYNSKIVNFRFPSILKDFKGRNKQLVIDCIDQYRDSIYKLYSICLDFDKQQLTVANVNGKIAMLCDKVEKCKKSFDNNIDTFNFDNKQAISSGLGEVYSILEKIILCNKTAEELSSFLKQSLFNLVLSSQKIFQSLN